MSLFQDRKSMGTQMSLGSPRDNANTIMGDYNNDIRSIATAAASVVTTSAKQSDQLQEIYGRVDTYNDFMQDQIDEEQRRKNAKKFMSLKTAEIGFAR